MNPFVLFASSNETDRRALIIGIVILLVLFLIIGLIGGALRFLFLRQSDRAEGMINNVVRAHVVNTPKELKRFGFRKNARALFRDTLWPFLIAFVGMLVWIIENIAVARWGDNIFADFADLFFWFDWGAEGVIVKFFGLPIIAAFPPVTTRNSTSNTSAITSSASSSSWQSFGMPSLAKDSSREWFALTTSLIASSIPP